MSHTLLQRHAFYSFFTFLNRKERLLSLFVTYTIIQSATCSEMFSVQAAAVAAPFQGLGFSMGGSIQDPYWIMGGNRTCDSHAKGM